MTQMPQPCPAQPSQLILETTIYNLAQLRAMALTLPQLALAGRSNVGKSSLLNALARRKQLAKISSTPGKTRSINLFKVEPDNFLLADLPGYGYARRSKSERQTWGELIEQYLTNSPLLQAVVLLLDCRLPPQDLDQQMADFCRARAIPILPVLTKADKAKQTERAERQKQWALLLGGQRPLPVSAKTGLGMRELWAELRRIADVPRPEQGQVEDA